MNTYYEQLARRWKVAYISGIAGMVLGVGTFFGSLPCASLKNPKMINEHARLTQQRTGLNQFLQNQKSDEKNPVLNEVYDSLQARIQEIEASQEFKKDTKRKDVGSGMRIGGVLLTLLSGLVSSYSREQRDRYNRHNRLANGEIR